MSIKQGGKIMKKVLFPLLTVLLLTLMVVGACAAPSAPATTPSTPSTTETPATKPNSGPITIIEANWTPAQMPPPMDWDPFDYVLNAWMDDIEQKSDGQIVFDRYPMETLVKVQDTWDAVKLGICDIGVLNECVYPGLFPSLIAVRMPGIFENAAQSCIIRHQLFDEGYFGHDWDDVKVLWMESNAPWDICCRTKQVKTLDDLKGLKIACVGGPEIPLLEALGATPVGMSPLDFYLALERGTVDAAWQDINGHISFKLWEAAPYSTRLKKNSNATMCVIMNKEKYESLPPDLKQLIDMNSGKLWAMIQGQRFNYNYNKSVAFLDENAKAPVYVLPPEEQAKWTEKTAVVIEETLAGLEAEGVPAHEMYDRAQELVEQYKLLGF
jgi:TRAP-type C4-dicarboxylate transport system substrate-binding protein